MSTRGFIGLAANGELKVMYNHYDSYPSGLGVGVLEYVKLALAKDDGFETLRQDIIRLKVVDPDVPPTEEEKEALKGYANLRVSERSLDDWYCLLYETHGDLPMTLMVGYVSDASDFPYGSLFAEWGYVIDADARQLEVYKGFQTSPHSDGRFADMARAETVSSGSTYYPVRLVTAFGFDELPDAKTFCKLADPGSEDEDDD